VFFYWQFFSQFEKQCWIIYGWHVDVELVYWFPLAMSMWRLDIDYAHFLYSIFIYYERKPMKLILDDHHLHTHELVPNLLHVSNESSMKFKHSRYAQLQYIHHWKLLLSLWRFLIFFLCPITLFQKKKKINKDPKKFTTTETKNI
jgi:hypothetical protein